MEILNVEKYKFKKQISTTLTIEDVLNKNNLFRLKNFAYTLGDCLFDTFEVMLHFSLYIVRNTPWNNKPFLDMPGSR